MVDQQHPRAPADARSRHGGDVRSDRRPSANRAEQRRSLEPGFGLLGLRIAVVEQGGPGANLAHAILHPDRAQSEPGIHVAVKGDPADGAAIPPARRSLLLLDKTDRPEFWRAGHGDRPSVAEKSVESVEFGSQFALDMVDRV